MRAIPEFVFDAQLTEDQLDEHASILVARALEPYLVAQRWFGDKARTVINLRSVIQKVVAIGDDFALLLIITVEFDSGEPVAYFVPLSASRTVPESKPIATFFAGEERWAVTDAVQNDAFRAWLLSGLTSSGVDSSGAFKWSNQAVGSPVVERALSGPSRVSAAQQSNSSIVYGNEIMLKLFRRLSNGINPEVELGRFLTAETTFRNMPLLLGEWSLTVPGQPSMSLAVAQTYIPSLGDGWSYTLDSIASGRPSAESIAGRLGQLTAQMHLALESAKEAPDLCAVLIDGHDIETWKAATLQAIQETSVALRDRADLYTGDTRDLIETFLSQVTQMSALAEGFERLIGCTKTRVHGDYHLGQTLRTKDDFVILDFEGEPQRSIEERRQKTSPCKDVAGMLRSFGYARGAIERANPESRRAELVTWERAARRAFLAQYIAESRNAGARYLPASDDDIRQAIAAWELDKALYEVNYELNNRPDWLALPLAATLKLT